MSDTAIIACLIVSFFGVTSIIIALKYDVDELIKFAAVYSVLLGAIGSYFFTEKKNKEYIAAIEENKHIQIALLKEQNELKSFVQDGEKAKARLTKSKADILKEWTDSRRSIPPIRASTINKSGEQKASQNDADGTDKSDKN